MHLQNLQESIKQNKYTDEAETMALQGIYCFL
jgi:hypothetical protein